jgi:hypothetical protein
MTGQQAFEQTLKKVLSVSHEELQRRLAAEKKAKEEKKPSKK